MTWIAQCGSCRRNYTAEDWKTLRLVGAMDPEDPEDPGHILELRNCKGEKKDGKACNSTLSIARQVEPATTQSRKVAVETLNWEAKGKTAPVPAVPPEPVQAPAPAPDPRRFGREFYAIPMTPGGYPAERARNNKQPVVVDTSDITRFGREANAIPCTPGGGVAERRAAKKR